MCILFSHNVTTNTRNANKIVHIFDTKLQKIVKITAEDRKTDQHTEQKELWER